MRRNKLNNSNFLAALSLLAMSGFEFNRREITLPRDPDPNLDSANKKIELARLAREEKYKNKRLTN